MLKNYIKKFLPHHDTIRQNKSLAIFGTLLYNPNLWVLNRRSAAGAFAIGLFCAFIPLPSQMIIAAGIALFCSVNLPLSIALVWITNPITMPFIYFFTYKLGALLLDRPYVHLEFEATWDFLSEQLSTIGLPFLLGSFVCGIFFAGLGFIGVHFFWRYSVAKSWQQRKARFPRVLHVKSNKHLDG